MSASYSWLWTIHFRDDEEAQSLPARARTVGVWLVTFAKLDGTGIRVSLDALADASGMSERTIRDGLRDLEASGWIRVVSGANRYGPKIRVLAVPESSRTGNHDRYQTLIEWERQIFPASRTGKSRRYEESRTGNPESRTGKSVSRTGKSASNDQKYQKDQYAGASPSADHDDASDAPGPDLGLVCDCGALPGHPHARGCEAA